MILNLRNFCFLFSFNLFVFYLHSMHEDKLENQYRLIDAESFIRNSDSKGLLGLIQRNPNLYKNHEPELYNHYWMARDKHYEYGSRAALSSASFAACALSGWASDSSGLRTASLFSLLFSGYYWNKARHANKIYNKLNEIDVPRINRMGPE